jgi:predicted RNA-binding Zn-ribbon protein involved in translation (DUF1610 family)
MMALLLCTRIRAAELCALQAVGQMLDAASQTVEEAPAPSNGAPVCPKCGSPMILRTAKSGANAGNRFWGCSGYPACRLMLPYSE